MRLMFAVVLDAVSRRIDLERKFLLLRRVLVLEQVSVQHACQPRLHHRKDFCLLRNIIITRGKQSHHPRPCAGHLPR